MAIILIDTCVVTDLADPKSAWFEWSASTLEKLDQNNTFVINPIIYAECSVGTVGHGLAIALSME